MSEVKDTGNDIMDTQETYCEDGEKNSSVDNTLASSMESQDFHLVDSGDEEPSSTQVDAEENVNSVKEEAAKAPVADTKETTENEEKKVSSPSATDQADCNQIQPEIDKDKPGEAGDTANSVETVESVKEVEEEHVNDTCAKEEETTETKERVNENVEGLTENTEKVNENVAGLNENAEKVNENVEGSNENTGRVNENSKELNVNAEELTECTPGEGIRPSKKQVLKRKGDSVDEPPNKIQRTTSNEDALLIDKEAMDQKANAEINEEKEEKSIEAIEEEVVMGGEKNSIALSSVSEDSKESEEAIENSQEIGAAKEMTNNACKSRMSIEVIYDKISNKQEMKSKPKELVEIDEDGEKIVLDSSQEDSDIKASDKFENSKADTTYKSCYESKSSDYSYKSVGSGKESSIDSKSDNRLVNGSTESKRCDTDSTASVQSDTFSDLQAATDKIDSNIAALIPSINNKQAKPLASTVRESESTELLSVSESEPDVSLVDNIGKSKSDALHSGSLSKALQVEREINMYVRLKCLLYVDEATKEYISKEVTAVYCDPTSDATLTRQKTNDTSASLADISGNDNKEGSPGSVVSNAQLFPLNPSRLSCASTISSISSVSSAASLAAKLALRDNAHHFSLPRAPAKHSKKCYQDMLPPPAADKHSLDESYDRLTKEWQNSRLITTSILSAANTELNIADAYNVSNERIDDQLQKIRSSTPEAPREETETMTPKSSRKGKAVKRARSKVSKIDGDPDIVVGKIYSKVLTPSRNGSTPRKKNKIEDSEIGAAGPSGSVDAVTNSLLDGPADKLVGRQVFAKWSDKNYYPGMVVDKVKKKYKVDFYDGQSKVLIEDFIIPMPETLSVGLSVYATTTNDDYGSSGLITEVVRVNDKLYYTVETDEREKLKVEIKNIFLSSDQAQLLKEEEKNDIGSLPSTPTKHLAQVTLDNVIEGKRRSRRIATPGFSTPKSRGFSTPSKSVSETEPSVSGVTSKMKKETKEVSENEGASSDSNVSLKQEETLFGGVQQEIIGTPSILDSKGPQNRIKGKARSKKKEDQETITTLGPIPPADSTLFKGISFILTCASLETIDRYQSDLSKAGSEAETEIEEEWTKKPFVRDRLRTQIIEGGGKVYEEFSEIPEDEYKTTKLISNVPNTTGKALLCLSVGIPVYSHNWIIRCCQENQIVNPAEDELPAGWSLEKRSYVEMFQRPTSKPFNQVVVIIPAIESEKRSASFWRQICENAGAVVILVEKAESMDTFGEGTLVLANPRCPTWVIDRSHELQIPLVSTTYIVQCLIEGRVCSRDAQPRFAYNHLTN